jgi:DNA-binding NarL/FixJ family response regulator
VTPPSTLRLLLVDDHPLVTAGLAATLGQEDGFASPTLADSVAQAVAFLESTSFDVVVSDVRLSDGTGFDVLERAIKLPSPPAVPLLSSFDIPQYAEAAYDRGASGFMLKTAPSEDVVGAIRRISAGSPVFDLRAAGSAPSRWRPLTVREGQVVAGVINGRSNDEIAGDLSISRKTVEAHLSKLFARAGVMTRTELALRAE